MSEFAGTKPQNSSVGRVAPELLPRERSSYVRQSTRRSFRGGLYAVTPLKKGLNADVGRKAYEAGTHLISPAFRQPAKPRQIPARHNFRLLTLTTDDFIQVRLATVRESTRHCFWPADVVAKFLAAEVITDSNGQ